VLDGSRAGAGVARRSVDVDACGVRIEEGQLDGVRERSAPPLIEKLMTSTPSMTACWMALTESEL
jgi:hypothetical protein